MNREIANRTHPAVTAEHIRRLAVVYLRQSTPEQVQKNTGSAQFQRSLAEVAQSYGWPDSQIKIIDEDLGRSGSSTHQRLGWQSLQRMIEARQVGAVFVANVSRLSRQVIDLSSFVFGRPCTTCCSIWMVSFSIPLIPMMRSLRK